jgi:hypothetical protein
MLTAKTGCDGLFRHDSASRRLVEGWEYKLTQYTVTAQRILEESECDLSLDELRKFEDMVAGCSVERAAAVCFVDFTLRNFRKSGLSMGCARSVILEGWRNFDPFGADNRAWRSFMIKMTGISW